jgi:ZIP family zinc transporter
MMDWMPTVIGTVSGVIGTGLGSTVAYFMKRSEPRLMAMLLGFSGGLMMAVVCFDLIPQALVLGSMGTTLAGLIIGVVMMMLIDFATVESSNEYIRMGTMMLIGIGAHNFPEGLAIGSGFAGTPTLGFGIALVIAFHDIPEGMSIGIPLRKGGLAPGRVVIYALLSGVPTGVGAFIGNLVGRVSPGQISLCLALAAGAMLYVTLTELVPSAYTLHKGRFSALSLVAGLIIGSVVCFLLT